MLCAADEPETVGEVDNNTVQEPSAAPATELEMLFEIVGAGMAHESGTRLPISLR